MLQRAPAAAAVKAPAHSDERSDYVDLLSGFQDLAVQAVNNAGRGLDTVHFGKDLTPAHRVFLEHVRRVLILAQGSTASRKTAIVEWPSVAAKMEAALDHAKQLHISGEVLASIADTVALVGEQAVHAPHRGPLETENSADYADLLHGINQLLDAVEQGWTDVADVAPANMHDTNQKQQAALTAVAFGGHLTTRHRQLLETLRGALMLARTESPGSASQALRKWQSIQGDLRHVLKNAPELIGTDAGAIRDHLNTIGQKLIHGGVYAEAHTKAVEETKLQKPGIAFDEERLKEATDGFKELHKFVEKAEQMTAENAIDVLLSGGKVEKYTGGKLTTTLAHSIFELVKNPGEIREKLEEFKKAGVIEQSVTVLDMADKILALRQAAYEVTLEIVKGYAEGQAKRVVEVELIEHWENVGKWAEGKLAMVKQVAKVAFVISLAISAIKIIDYIRQGKWAEVARETGEMILGLGSAAAVGAGGSATIGGIGIVVAAEIEGLSGAAAMISWCRTTSVREAALDFIGVCSTAAGVEAQDLVANVKLLADQSAPSEKAFIEQRLASDVPHWMRHLEILSDQLNETRTISLGGQPRLQQALGDDALRILRNPATWGGSWESMAEQIRVIFAGANAMAKYVVDNYPRHEKKAESGEEKEGGDKE